MASNRSALENSGGSLLTSLQVPMKNTSLSWSLSHVSSEPKRRAETPESVAPLDGSAAQALLDLVAEQDGGHHGVGNLQRLPDILLGLADERTHQRADVERERGSPRFVTQRLGKG